MKTYISQGRVAPCLLTLVLALAACTDGVLKLPEGQQDSGAVLEPDLGFPVDGGFRTDLGTITPDMGFLPPDMGFEMPDAGQLPKTCPQDWVPLATSMQESGFELDSVAISDEGILAVTYTEGDENWQRRGFASFFTLEGQAVNMPQQMGAYSKVLAHNGRFLIGGPQGLHWYQSDGMQAAEVIDRPFFPDEVFAGKIYGRVPVENSTYYIRPAVLSSNLSTLTVFDFQSSVRDHLVFGPDQVLRAAVGDASYQIEGYRIVGDTLEYNESYILSIMQQPNGSTLFPGRLAAIAWSQVGNYFELTVDGMQGRMIRPLAYRISGAQVLPQPTFEKLTEEVTHGLLNADLSINGLDQVTSIYSQTLKRETPAPYAEVVINRGAQEWRYPVPSVGARHGNVPVALAERDQLIYVVTVAQLPDLPSSNSNRGNQLVFRCIRP